MASLSEATPIKVGKYRRNELSALLAISFNCKEISNLLIASYLWLKMPMNFRSSLGHVVVGCNHATLSVNQTIPVEAR